MGQLGESAGPSELLPSDGTNLIVDTVRNGSQQRQYRGVTFEKNTAKWRARLYWRGNHLTLGRFKTAELAAGAYDEAAVFVWGPDATTNLGHVRSHDVNLLKRCNYRRLLALREQVEQVQETIPDEARMRAARFAAACYALNIPIERAPSHPPNRKALSGAWKALVLAAAHCSRAF